MREVKLIAVSLVLLVGGYVLERGGMFLYSGYTVVRTGAVLAALAVILWGFLISRGERWTPMLLGVVVGCFVLALGWQLGSARTSARKAFYLDAVRVKEGMPFKQAQQIMAAYRPFSVEPGHESFCYRSGPQTEDVLVVHYDPATMKVVKAELSLD
jgi:hypothetical protein